MASPLESKTLLYRCVNIGLLLLIAFLWASAFGAMKVAVPETGPMTLAAARSSIAAVILLLLLRLKGPIAWHLMITHFSKFLIIGGVGTALPFMMIPWAELYVESSLAGLLISIGPLATLAGAWAFGIETNIPKRRLIGLLLGLCGVIFILQDGFVSLGSAHLIAQIVIVISSLCYVCGNLMVRYVSFIPPLTISALAMSLASCFLWPIALLFEQPAPAAWSPMAWQMILWLGIMPTALAFSIRYYLIGRAGPSFTSYVGYLIPAISVIIGAVWLGEAITQGKIAALALILFGLLLAQKPSTLTAPSQLKG